MPALQNSGSFLHLQNTYRCHSYVGVNTEHWNRDEWKSRSPTDIMLALIDRRGNLGRRRQRTWELVHLKRQEGYLGDFPGFQLFQTVCLSLPTYTNNPTLTLPDLTRSCCKYNGISVQISGENIQDSWHLGYLAISKIKSQSKTQENSPQISFDRRPFWETVKLHVI